MLFDERYTVYHCIPGMYHLCTPPKERAHYPTNDQKGKPENHRLQTYRPGGRYAILPREDIRYTRKD